MAEPTDDPSSNDQASRFHTILTLLKISFGFLFELFPRPIVYFLEYSCWHFFTLLIGGSDIWNYPNVTKSFCDPISSHIFSLLLPACLSLHRKENLLFLTHSLMVGLGLCLWCSLCQEMSFLFHSPNAQILLIFVHILSKSRIWPLKTEGGRTWALIYVGFSNISYFISLVEARRCTRTWCSVKRK